MILKRSGQCRIIIFMSLRGLIFFKEWDQVLHRVRRRSSWKKRHMINFNPCHWKFHRTTFVCGLYVISIELNVYLETLISFVQNAKNKNSYTSEAKRILISNSSISRRAGNSEMRRTSIMIHSLSMTKTIKPLGKIFISDTFFVGYFSN